MRYLLTFLFTVLLAAPAYADGFYVEAKATVNAESLSDYEDTFSGAGAIGYDLGQYRVAAEYYAGRAKSPDAAFLMGYVDFGDGAFQPFIGLGAGVSLDDIAFEDIDNGDFLAQASAGVSYGVTDHVRVLAGYSYQAAFDNIDDGEGQIFAGARVGF